MKKLDAALLALARRPRDDSLRPYPWRRSKKLPYSHTYKKNKSPAATLIHDLHPRPRCGAAPQIPDLIARNSSPSLELQLDFLDGPLLLRYFGEHLLEAHPRCPRLFPLMFLYSFFLIKKVRETLPPDR
jgi:hypothetical protein